MEGLVPSARSTVDAVTHPKDGQVSENTRGVAPDVDLLAYGGEERSSRRLEDSIPEHGVDALVLTGEDVEVTACVAVSPVAEQGERHVLSKGEPWVGSSG